MATQEPNADLTPGVLAIEQEDATDNFPASTHIRYLDHQLFNATFEMSVMHIDNVEPEDYPDGHTLITLDTEMDHIGFYIAPEAVYRMCEAILAGRDKS